MQRQAPPPSATSNSAPQPRQKTSSPASSASATGRARRRTYRTLLDELVAQNITPTRAFSLGLGGKIIPAGDSPDGVRRYWVQLEGIKLSPPGGGKTGPYIGLRTAVFLDSGATFTLLPPELVGAIARDFGAGEEDEEGLYPVGCGLVGMEGSLDFEFAGVVVIVPYGEIIRELRSPPRCYPGIGASEEFVIWGDTFLRSAYGMLPLTLSPFHFPSSLFSSYPIPCIPFPLIPTPSCPSLSPLPFSLSPFRPSLFPFFFPRAPLWEGLPITSYTNEPSRL